MRRIVILALVLIVTAGGCSKTLDPPVDTEVALDQMKSVFRAWKAGESYESLAQRSPPVYFNEALWRDGTALLEFELGEVELFGRQGRCTVRLFLRGKDGKAYERTIGYQIDTTPNIVIVREGLGP